MNPSPSRRCAALRATSRSLHTALQRNADLLDRNKGMEAALAQCEDDVQCLARLARRPLAQQRDALAEVQASLLKATQRLLLAVDGCPHSSSQTPRPPSTIKRSSTAPRRRYL